MGRSFGSDDVQCFCRVRATGDCRKTSSYSPFPFNFDGDVLARAVSSMPFADPSIGDPTLVTPAMLSQATVTARTYEVRDHFVRQLVIPQIRLREWATE